MDPSRPRPPSSRPLFQTDLSSPRNRPVRVPFRLPVWFREKRRIRADAQGVVVNVSETGLYVAIRHPPGINDIVLLSLPGAGIDGDARPLRIRGQVRWWRTLRATTEESLGFGVKILDFPDADHRDRYRTFVSRLLSDADPSRPEDGDPGPPPDPPRDEPA